MKRFLTEKSAAWLMVMGLAIILLAIVFLITGMTTSPGVLGDFIGGISGSLWALAGVILFYIALKSQQAALEDQRKATQSNVDALENQIEALKVQKDDLALQRKELEETRKVFIEQSKTLKLQQFETSFFNLLQTHREVLKNVQAWEMDLVKEKEKIPGVAVFGSEALFHLWMRFELQLPKVRQDIRDDQMDSSYTQIISGFRPYLEPYFLTVYHILKFIDRSSDTAEKIEYARLYRAQLTIHELRHLFYDCRLPMANKLKTLMEKYNMFVRLGPKDIIHARHRDVFDASAFTES